jgi:phosphonate transport system ATP-binding protein
MTNAAHAAGASASAAWPIRLNDASVTYPNGTAALKNVSLTIEPGEMVAVVGLSGSGKSTLIRTVNGLVPVTSGSVTVGPHEVSSLKGRGMRDLRSNVGMIFQAFNLAERVNVYRNTLVGRFAGQNAFRSFFGIASAEDRRIALSGGQKQRVAIARALSQDPRVMLADEPVASLDPPTAHAVMHELTRLNAERGLTVLVNLHLMDLARDYTTRMIGLRYGEVVYDGPAASATDADFEQIYGRRIQPQDRLGRVAQ